MSLTLYIVAPPGGVRDAVVASLGGNATAFDSVDRIGALGDLEPGVLLLDPAAASAEEMLACASRASKAGPGWCVARVYDEEGEARVQTISLGPPNTLEEAGAFAGDPSAHKGYLLELGRVLMEAGRLRHDLNNPLTAALGETQLLLAEHQGDAVRESLQVVQEQLRRIRDLIAAASHLRDPGR